jgi:hypothetical protein
MIVTRPFLPALGSDSFAEWLIAESVARQNAALIFPHASYPANRFNAPVAI